LATSSCQGDWETEYLICSAFPDSIRVYFALKYVRKVICSTKWEFQLLVKWWRKYFKKRCGWKDKERSRQEGKWDEQMGKNQLPTRFQFQMLAR
jgi:hypothetical protein